jgi:hypothetical protein
VSQPFTMIFLLCFSVSSIYLSFLDQHIKT